MATFLGRRALSGAALMLIGGAAAACGGGDEVSDDARGGSGGDVGTGGESMLGDETGGATGEGSGGDGSGGMPAAGGMPATGGNDGTGGGPLNLDKSNKIDVLFVLDNSVSMDDEHKHLIPSAQRLFENLANPPCSSDSGGEQVVSENGLCPDGYTIEFAPRRDMHVGVISTSIGARGGNGCPEQEDWQRDDRAYLIPRVRDGVVDPNGNGILTWTGGTDEALAEMSDQLGQHLAAAGTRGCGFEQPLESVYRFLVDPSPDESTELNPSTNRAESTGIDTALLAQRAEFLRPDSAVIVVVLSDEDDCSMMAGGNHYDHAGFGYLTGQTRVIGSTPFLFPVATPECESNPNDPCCFSCLQSGSPPSGCEETAVATCEATSPAPKLTIQEDRANVRCFDQKRRFGVDLLYPVERYVDGLSELRIIDTQNGDEVKNPLFHDASGKVTRDPNWVYMLSIVGVPWQDLATPESLEDPNSLEYLGAEELEAKDVSTAQGLANRWELMLGDPENNVSPLDPFMRASIDERSGESPIVVDGSSIASIVPSNANSWNVINGHEYNPNAPDEYDQAPVRDELQTACIYPRSAPLLDCALDEFDCDCGDETGYATSTNRAICSDDQSASTPATNNQYYGKGHPGSRELAVTRGLGERGVPASICPKIIDHGSDHGAYNPAVDALIRRLGDVLE